MKAVYFSILLGIVFTPAFGFFQIQDLDYANSPYDNKDMPSIGESIRLSYQIINRTPEDKMYEVSISIMNLDQSKLVYENIEHHLIKADEYKDIIWNFTPQTPGPYSVVAIEDSGKTTKYIFAVPENEDFRHNIKQNPSTSYNKTPLQQFRMGLDPKTIKCKEGLYLALKPSSLPICVNLDTLEELRKRDFVISQFIEYEKIGHFLSEAKFKEILTDKNISYNQSDFMVIEGMMLPMGIPEVGYCGYVMSNEQQEYWFSSSTHGFKLLNFEIHEENPEPCFPNTFSCFCSLQTQLAEKDTSELTYFTKSEEDEVGKSVSQYLNDTQIANVSNQFIVGKYNLESDLADRHYCGAFLWGANLKNFEGYIKNGKVVDFMLASYKPKLCAISDDARTFTFDESSIVKDSFVGQ